jgi:hypothetical protein
VWVTARSVIHSNYTYCEGIIFGVVAQ